MYKKYPRTPHLPWSPGATNDDKMLDNTDHFENHYVVITEKRDGECTTIYPDHIHARSLDSKDHYSRHYVKALQARLRQDMPDGMRICGENLHYTKSLPYNNLKDFFEVFSFWKDEMGDDMCLSWGETLEWCDLLGLIPVPELWRGTWNEKEVRKILIDTDLQEGYVVRTVYRFHYNCFATSVAKYVRKKHVQTDEHWMHKELIKNKLQV